MAEARPNRNTYRLTDANYDLVWHEHRERHISMNDALNRLLEEARRARLRRRRDSKVTAAVATS